MILTVTEIDENDDYERCYKCNMNFKIGDEVKYFVAKEEFYHIPNVYQKFK